jgi:hypothetical protein
MDPDPAPNPANFVIDVQDAGDVLFFFLGCSAYFLKVHLHYFSKIKSNKKVTKQ